MQSDGPRIIVCRRTPRTQEHSQPMIMHALPLVLLQLTSERHRRNMRKPSSTKASARITAWT